MVDIRKLYSVMAEHCGEQNWPAESKPEIILGAILVQNTSWESAQKSLDLLEEATNFDPYKILELNEDELQKLIRPSGFYRNKSKTIQGIFQWLKEFDFDYQKIREHFGDQLRTELLKLRGIGNETADILLIYVFNVPMFVADNYARKLFAHLGVPSKNYQELAQKVQLPQDFTAYEAQIFHGLIDEFGKKYFRGQDTFAQSFLAGFK